MSAPVTTTSSTRLVPCGGRLIVDCVVQHVVASGASLADVFARIRPELQAAMREAVSRDPDAAEFASSSEVRVDESPDDPWLAIAVLNPKRCLANLDEHMECMQAIAARFFAARVAGGVQA